MTDRKYVGVIGSGSFGTAIANLLAYNVEVLIYSRNAEIVETINTQHQHMGLALNERIQATSDLKFLAEHCTLLFPVVPSANFREMMQNIGPYLRPFHILIHGTKGFDISYGPYDDPAVLLRHNIHTMSAVIRQESVVVRIGCLSGPNLASEIVEGQPTATVIASQFNEVIEKGKQVLSSPHFAVFGSHEVMGAELAGALKNAIAIGSGILHGMGLGKNIQALLITRGLMEMISFGRALGSSPKPFLGTAGIGDLICTATSTNSRNFTFGQRLGAGESIETIKATMPELAEGVRTIEIANRLGEQLKLQTPITSMLYRTLYEGYPIERAIELLMRYPYHVDVDFLE